MFNADLIARSLIGGYTLENFAKAEEILRDRIRHLISEKSDFMIESNLATQKDYDWINAMIKTGYEVVVFFLCTSYIDIHVKRVKHRVAEGGHNIAEPIIVHRYKMGLTYLRGNLHVFKRAFLIDNAGETALVMAEVAEGKLQYKIKMCRLGSIKCFTS